MLENHSSPLRLLVFLFQDFNRALLLPNIQSDFNLIPDRGPVSVPSPASSSYSSSSASFRGSVPEGAEYAVLKLSGQSGGGGTVDVYVQVIKKCLGFFSAQQIMLDVFHF